MNPRTALLELPPAHSQALELLLDLVPPAELRWVLTGSAGLRLQGVDLPVNDLDIQSAAETVYRIEERLQDYIQTPVHLWESPRTRSLDGKAQIAGVEVELLADIAHRMPDGSWRSLTDFGRIVWLAWRGREVPVFPLEDEAAAYQAMGRAGKADLIRKTIEQLHKGGS